MNRWMDGNLAMCIPTRIFFNIKDASVKSLCYNGINAMTENKN